MEKKNERPNLIWIFGDQHRAQMLSCNGDPNLCTPNIDRLAANGVNFENAVAGFPLCCPFRGSLLTSRYPHECVPGNKYLMPPEMPTVAHAFKENGYHTAYFGKWHLDGFKEGKEGRAAFHVVPPERRGGFDHWVGYENNNAQWDCWVHGTGIEKPVRLPGYETDSLTDIFIEHIKGRNGKKQGKPFFAALSVQPPHAPYVAPEEWMRRHNPTTIQLRPNVPNIKSVEPAARREIAGAYAMVENLDWNVGRIISALQESGLADNTYIIFFSDHGDMHGSQGQFRKTLPFEESIRIPFIISAAGSLGTRYITPSSRCPELINHVDIAPTSLGLCGIEKPSWMRGFDYSGFARRSGSFGTETPDSAYIQCVDPSERAGGIRPWRGIVTRDGWKYVCLENQPWLMFNLKDDPYEQANLVFSSKKSKIRAELHERLQTWISELGDNFVMPKS
ncbi:MAG TPA: sulfatase [Victivallales bacterium]|nr:sulfatase [Victivallales bacterium]